MTPGFWRDRPVLVTGATGLVGAGSPAAWSRPAPTWSAWCAIGFRKANWSRSGTHRAREGRARRHPRSRRCSSAPSANTKSTPSFTSPRRPSSASPTAIPISTFESNIQGTWNLLEACRRSPRVKSIVVASSDKAYGDQEKLPYSEDTPLQGRHPYDVSKICADLIAQTYAQDLRTARSPSRAAAISTAAAI